MQIEDIKSLFKTESFIDEINSKEENVSVAFLRKHIFKFYPDATNMEIRICLKNIFDIPYLENVVKKSQIISKLMEPNKMEIEIRFKPWDEVLYLEGSKLKKEKIHSIKIEVENDGKVAISYYFKVIVNEESGDYTYVTKDESLVFASLDEFLNQIFK